MNEFQKLLESYGMMTRSQRLFYPRNFNLSPEFINSLKREIERQHKSGMDLVLFERKLGKALQFFIADYKKMQGMKSVQRADQEAQQLAAEAKAKKKTP